jgi:hypothetical protein
LRTKIRTRRAQRAIAELDAREAEIVAFMLDATNGKGWPWPKHVHAALANHLGTSRIRARDYLGALRRTLGLPVRYDLDGPLLKTLAWRRKAKRTGDFGVFAPLHPPEALTQVTEWADRERRRGHAAARVTDPPRTLTRMTDDFDPEMAPLLSAKEAAQVFANSRGSERALEYAERLERSYVGEGRGTPKQRRFVAELCEWLRNPQA